MKGQIILVTGGARSGKSEFAEQFVKQKSDLIKAPHMDSVGYIATAEAKDQEMQERIEIHQKRRPSSWKTYELGSQGMNAFSEAISSCHVVLFDCLTMFVANQLFAYSEKLSRLERQQAILADINQLLLEASQSSSIVVFVTNELGLGIVPDNALAREYRDLVGLVNQTVAQAAEEVFFVVSGISLPIKSLGVSL